MQTILTGFHAVEEAAKNAKEATPAAEFTIFYDAPGPRIKKILQLAQSKKLAAVQTEKQKLDNLVKNLPPLLQNHRGLVLVYNFSEKHHSLEASSCPSVREPCRYNSKVAFAPSLPIPVIITPSAWFL